jgi:hypothetical protein
MSNSATANLVMPDVPSGLGLGLLEVLRKLGNGFITVDQAYNELSATVNRLLPPNASERHGELLGLVLAVNACGVPPIPKSRFIPSSAYEISDEERRQRCLRSCSTSWSDATAEPASPLAVQNTIWMFWADVRWAVKDEAAKRAIDLLKREKLTAIANRGVNLY